MQASDHSQPKVVPSRPRASSILAASVFVALALFAVSRYSYPLFHTVVEIFSMVVAATVFVIAWNSRHLLGRDYLLFIGVAFLFFTVLDLPHTTAYSGIELFSGYTANLPTQLYIIQRYMLSLSFLVAPAFLYRRMPRKTVFAVFGTLTFLALASVLWWRNFPVAFVPGVGLTPFKVYSEYVIASIFGLSIVAMWRNRDAFDRRVLSLVAASAAAFIASELMFTLYSTPFGLPNFLGHLAQVLAFYLLYIAVVRTALIRPFALLYKELADSEDRYRRVAETLQTELLRIPDAVSGVALAHEYHASSDLSRIGGDFYDIFELDRGRVGMVLGDVSGKGLGAATTTAEVKSVIRAMAELDPDPGVVLTRANEIMHKELDDTQFITTLYALVDVDTGRLRMASAGHPDPVICRISGSCELFSPPRNPPLGPFTATDYESHDWVLEPGDTIVMFTDGLTEARRGDRFFGEDGVLEAVGGASEKSPQQIVSSTVAAARDFAGGRLGDDAAILAVQLIRGTPTGKPRPS